MPLTIISVDFNDVKVTMHRKRQILALIVNKYIHKKLSLLTYNENNCKILIYLNIHGGIYNE